MKKLTRKDLETLGVDPEAELPKLSDAQVRKVIAKCAHAGAVKFGPHSEEQLLDRGGSRADVYRCLKQGGIVEGKTEPSRGGGVKMVLRHLFCGEQFNTVVAIDQIDGPSFVVTIYFED